MTEITRQTVLDYLARNPGDNNKKEIARGLGANGEARRQLRQILKELEDEGVAPEPQVDPHTAMRLRVARQVHADVGDPVVGVEDGRVGLPAVGPEAPLAGAAPVVARDVAHLEALGQ